jgi:hypothetical protein
MMSHKNAQINVKLRIPLSIYAIFCNIIIINAVYNKLLPVFFDIVAIPASSCLTARSIDVSADRSSINI